MPTDDAVARPYAWRTAKVTATHELPLRGHEVDRRAWAEILQDGRVIARSERTIVPAGKTVVISVDLTADPGSYPARQATNTGSNIHESIVYIDLDKVDHPPPKKESATKNQAGTT